MTTALEASTIPLGPRDAGAPMTPGEFEAADYEPGWRYELIHGVLVVTPPPLEEERDPNEELGHWLRTYRDFHPQGDALDLTLPERNVWTGERFRRADRAIWCGMGRRPRTRGRRERRVAPSIIVEFRSSRPADQRRDYQEKRIEFRELNVQEYWIIDRFARTMTLYHWRGKRWVKKTIREGETYSTPLLPGFEIPLAKLLAFADRYADQ